MSCACVVSLSFDLTVDTNAEMLRVRAILSDPYISDGIAEIGVWKNIVHREIDVSFPCMDKKTKTRWQFNH